MSRSYLRDKYVKERTERQRKWKGKDLNHLILIDESRNPHKKDEMPKNKASKSITKYCKDDIEHLNRPTYCSGHSTNKGRRIVSGIVRASRKREINKEIQEEEI